VATAVLSPLTHALARRSRNTAGWLERILHRPRAPLWLLGGVSLASLAARLIYLAKPFNPSTHSAGLIFDEQYYVNAARVILGIQPGAGNAYAQAALFHDPNAEHPPLVKLLIAGTMKVFGDNPWGWRIAPVIFGSMAILAMFWLVRSARGSAWLALGAATLMAVDNLLLIHARVATLDIFVVTFMIVTVALYLRGRPLLAGLALGVGLCTKIVAVDGIFILVLLEVARVLMRNADEVRGRLAMARAKAITLAKLVGVAAVTYVGLLFVLDLWVAPIGGPGNCPTVAGGFHNPLLHTVFMLCFAGKLTSPGGPTGIASYPWQWLLNQSAIDYYTLANNVVSGGKVITTHAVVTFQGEMNPAIIFLAMPGLALAIQSAWQRRDTYSVVSAAWFLGTFVPFVLAAAPLGSYGNRTSYLYYMVVVLPGVYMAVAQLFSRRWLPRAALIGYAAILGYWFVTLFPIRTWTGS